MAFPSSWKPVSTLLRELNGSDCDGAAAEFGKWIYATVNGQKTVLQGLVKRGTAGALVFQGLDWRAALEDGCAAAPDAADVARARGR